MSDKLLQELEGKKISKEELLRKVRQDFNLLPEILRGIDSSNATVRYGCAKILMNLSEEHPEKLYPHMNYFISLLDSRYRILTWNAMVIIANLTRIDTDKKFDSIFEKYYSFINDEYMVTVANVIGNSGKIALAKPYLVDEITNRLLSVEDISTTPHLTEECKMVIVEKTIQSFDVFFDKIEHKENVISFVAKYVNSPRRTLRRTAENFLKKVSGAAAGI